MDIQASYQIRYQGQELTFTEAEAHEIWHCLNRHFANKHVPSAFYGSTYAHQIQQLMDDQQYIDECV